jgi:hypothetical protein
MRVGDYRVVYRGECPPGVAAHAVKSRLQGMFRGDPTAFEAAFAALPLTLARGLEPAAAGRLRDTLARRGIPCRIEGPGRSDAEALREAPAPVKRGAAPGAAAMGDEPDVFPPPSARGDASDPADPAPAALGLMRRMLVHPRGAIHGALLRTSPAMPLILGALGGIAQFLPPALAQRANVDGLPPGVFVPALVVVAALLGVGWLLLRAVLLAWTGRWLGGGTGARAMRTVVAWSEIPMVLGMLLWVPRGLLLGPLTFAGADAMAEAGVSQTLAAAGFGWMQTALEIWALVLLLHALAEVQGWSLRRALASLLLAAALAAAPAALLALWLI